MSCKSIVLDGVNGVAKGDEESWGARSLLYSTELAGGSSSC